MSIETFARLTKKGKRRAIIVEIVGCIIGACMLFIVGYACCALAAGLQLLAGVWG